MNTVIQPISQASTIAVLTAVLESFDAATHYEKPEERILLNWYEILDRFDELHDSYIKAQDMLSLIPKVISGARPHEPGISSTMSPRRSAGSFRLRISELLDSSRMSSTISPVLNLSLAPSLLNNSPQHHPHHRRRKRMPEL